MSLHRVWIVVMLLWGLVGPLAAQTPGPATHDSLSNILVDLQGVEADLVANKEKIEAMKAKIAQLQSLGKDAEAEIISLQALVEAHAARVEQLGDRYAKVLVLAQRLKKDLEFSVTLNYALGAGATVAVVVAIVEGLALLHK